MSTTTPTTTTGLVGKLAGDPELRFSAAGKASATFRLVVKPFVPGASEQPPPEYYSVVTFGSLAENACENLTKGSRVVLSGRVEDDRWVGRDGQERVSQKVIADAVGKDLRFAEPAKRTAPTGNVSSQPTPHGWADDYLAPTPEPTLEPF